MKFVIFKLLWILKKTININYLNQPFFCDFTSGEVLIFGDSSTLPLIIIKGTNAQRDKNNIQNK